MNAGQLQDVETAQVFDGGLQECGYMLLSDMETRAFS